MPTKINRCGERSQNLYKASGVYSWTSPYLHPFRDRWTLQQFLTETNILGLVKAGDEAGAGWIYMYTNTKFTKFGVVFIVKKHV